MTLHRRSLVKRTGLAGAALVLGSRWSQPAAFAQDAQELVFWDTLNTDPRLMIADTLAKAFSDANGGMKVTHRGWTLEELTDTLPRSVEGKQGPAVAQVNNGESLAGPMARGKQIISLQSYAEKYGWEKKLPEGLLARNRYTPDGKTFGTGDLFGMSAECEIVGLYFNRTVFADNGIEIPKTVADLESAMGKLREAGVEPLLLGGLDKWQLIHLFGMVQGTLTTREYLDNLIYRRNDASFDDPSMMQAAETLVKWKENNYFLQGFEGINGDDAIPVFTSGGGAMLMQGSWAAGQVAEGLQDEGGFFLMPPQKEGDTVMNVGGVGIPYSVTSNAADKDLAAELINSFVSDDAVSMFLDAGILPSAEIPADRIRKDTVSGDMYAAWNGALERDEIGHYLDWATPDFFDVLTGEVQKLLAGETDPKAFVAALQDAYAKSFQS